MKPNSTVILVLGALTATAGFYMLLATVIAYGVSWGTADLLAAFRTEPVKVSGSQAAPETSPSVLPQASGASSHPVGEQSTPLTHHQDLSSPTVDKMETNEDRILAWVKQHPSSRPRHDAPSLHLPYFHMAALMKQLKSEGLLRGSAVQGYVLTDASEERLREARQ